MAVTQIRYMDRDEYLQMLKDAEEEAEHNRLLEQIKMVDANLAELQRQLEEIEEQQRQPELS